MAPFLRSSHPGWRHFYGSIITEDSGGRLGVRRLTRVCLKKCMVPPRKGRKFEFWKFPAPIVLRQVSSHSLMAGGWPCPPWSQRSSTFLCCRFCFPDSSNHKGLSIAIHAVRGRGGYGLPYLVEEWPQSILILVHLVHVNMLLLWGTKQILHVWPR